MAIKFQKHNYIPENILKYKRSRVRNKRKLKINVFMPIKSQFKIKRIIGKKNKELISKILTRLITRFHP